MQTAEAKTGRVLLIDDDDELTELVTEYLRREGLEAHVAGDGESGTRKALTGEYSVIVLDVMLPGIGGFEVLRRIRAANSAAAKLPILMLTARGDEVDRVLGLELGADDYLPKPFSSRELVARLRAILRRAQAVHDAPASTREILHAGDLELSSSKREVLRGGVRIELTSAEFDLLRVLLQNAGNIVSREIIAETALGRPLLAYDRSIDVHISNLRRKLGPDARGIERIKSVRGVGYIYAQALENSVLTESTIESIPQAKSSAS